VTGRYVGARVMRVEDPRFLAGRGVYLDDIEPAGTLHVAFLRSPHAHARIVSVDCTQARALAGVALVVTGEDLRDLPPFTTTIATRPETTTGTRHMLPLDRVRFVGEAVAAVVARSRAIAEDAAELIDVEYERLPPVLDAEAALAPGAPVLHEELGGNNFAHIEFEAGDVDGAFAGAAHVFRKRFHFGRCHAAPLEGRGVIADWDVAEGSVTVWTSTQMPFLVRGMLAAQFGLADTRVRVICPAVGGGFGLKVQLFVEEAIVPELSRRLSAPVKWVEDRYEALAASGHAKEVICELALATDADGRFLALEGHYTGDGGAYLAHPWTSLIDPLCAASFLPGMYDVQNVRYQVDTPFTNKCQSTAYRGVGWTPGQAAREALIEDAARALGIDSLELRLRNTIPDGVPYRSATGCNYDGGSFAESIRRAKELIGYDALRARQRELRAQGRYLGIGFSPFVEQGAWAGAIAAANGFPDFNYLDSVSVTMEPDGTVTLTTGLQSNGQGHETTMAQLAADELGVALEDVKVVQGDTTGTAYATGSYGSRTAVIGSGAIIRAAGDVRDKLLAIAAHLFEAAPDDLELAAGSISVLGSPEKSFTIREVATAAYWGPRPDDMDPALVATRSYDPPETYSNACIAVVAEVDAETGQVRIERIVAVEDCGTVLNPAVVEGQVIGAIAQGIGSVLYEQLPYDEDGNFLAGTLVDFLYPTAPEVPAIEVDHLETPSPVTEGGFKGMGEGGLIGGPSAIVNAISDALGVPVDRTPLRPCDVLELVEQAQAAASI
jgi:carbon-monoxide dehydrogenase large subunit